MAVSEILILRHAEKPDKERQETGLSPEGLTDDRALNARGWQRAGALALLLGRDGRVRPDLPNPEKIYASALREGGGHSHRPQQTVGPLAARLSLEVKLDWSLNMEAPFAEELRRHAGTQLVCWQHEGIAALARAIVAPQVLSEIPAGWTWPKARFDVIWCLRRQAATGPWQFAQYCQRLLPGDPETPLEFGT
ncbi:histidine phosphatase family protein [Gluconacetobacter tumulisoli]|uniref:Histidine phosphatase family protein n=1 Tax=Gluconacetobacter tumulisoli TaxID=1286189 RepID=A0A7W4PNU9_9PROT|nr:histidine phosphatase family protein [Gluconacetobacter tumulisoli]MBB2202959.1 histidine phosphatase family protein [Gluconacetobacter tumulisoli]